MSTPSDWDAYSYAKFLVDIFPDDAVEILRRKGSWDIIKLVEQQVDNACIKLGGGSKNEIKGMVENRRWNELKDLRLRESPLPSATTPRDYRRTGARPPSPSSTASGSPHLQRISNCDWITVYQTGFEVPLTAKPSGSEDYLIGEDKLERFQGLKTSWINPTKQVDLGGQLIEVAEYVDLTWNHGEGASKYNKFWVVRPELIRLADVLLGYSRKQQPRDRQGKAVNSPLSLGPQASRIPPQAPTPPQQQMLYQARGPSSSALYSIPGNTVHDFGQDLSHNDITMPNHRSLRPSGRAPTMISAPPTHHDHPSPQPSLSIDRPPSRTGSASSNRIAKSSRLETVLVQLSFEGTGRRLLPLDLTKNADQVIPYLESHISRMCSKQLDRSIHEIEIIPLKEDGPEPESSSLSDFDYSWDAMVEFMRENRTDETNKKPEFRFAIFRPPGS